MAGLSRTYTFSFAPDPEGGFVTTCASLPGLVTHGASLAEARKMARDAMQGYIEVLIEDGERVPDSDQAPVTSRAPASGLGPRAVVEQLTASIVVEAV